MRAVAAASDDPPSTAAAAAPLSHARGLVELFVAAILFGLTAFVAKRATAEADGSQVALLRFAIGLAFVFAQSAVRRAPLRPRRWGVLLLRGVFGGLAVLAYFVSLNELPVGTATLLNCTSPAFAALFAVTFLRERLPPQRLSALLCAGGGIALVVYGQGKALGGGYGWQVLALLSGIASGAAVVSIRAARRTDGPWEIFGMFCLVGLVCTAPMALARWRELSLETWWLLLGVGLLSLAAQILMTHAYGAVEAATGVTISQLTVVVSMMLGHFVDGETLSTTSLVGTGLTLAGVVWVAWSGAPIPRGEAP